MRVHHIALRTRDLAALERFYAGVLGLAVLRRTSDESGERSVWLDASGTIVMLERVEAGEAIAQAGTKETLAFAIEAGARADYVRRFAEAGVAIESLTDFTLYVRDPDARRVAVSHHPVPVERAR